MRALARTPSPLALIGLFSLLGTAAAQEPSLSAAALLPGDLTVVPAAGDQRTSDLVPGGAQLLALWTEQRTALFTTQGQKDVWAARYDQTGQAIDVLGFPVTQGGGDQEDPRGAWNGSEWLVAWSAQVPTQFYYTDGIEAARVAADGTVLDTTPILVTTASNSGNLELWHVASDGGGWTVFWKDWGGSTWELRAARIAADGTLLDAVPAVLATASSQPYGGDVAFALDEYLVVWKEWSGSTKEDVRALRVTPALAPIGAPFVVASHFYYETHPAVATDGVDFFVVWERYDSCCVGGGGKVFGSRILHDGTVLDGPEGLPIYAPPLLYGTTGREPDVVWDGANWLATFTKPVAGTLRIDAARVSPAGLTLDPDGFDVDPFSARQEASTAAALPGGGSLVLWTDSRAGGALAYDVFGARITTAGLSTPLGAQALSAPSQAFGDLVAVPGGALAVWTSYASGSRRVLVQKLDGTGGALQAEPLELFSGSDVGNAHAAWNGSVVLATWDGGGVVSGMLLDASGQPLSGAPLTIMPGWESDLSSLGTEFLVTALHAPTNPEFVFVFSRRVAADGSLLDGSPVFVGSSFARSQAVQAFDGGYLVAWQRNFTHDDVNSALHLRFVSAQNTPGLELVVANGITDGGHNEQPAMAVDDAGQALLTWQVRKGGGNWDVVGRRVSAGLALPDATAIPVTVAPNEQLLPAVAWTGSEFVVAWQDRRNAELFYDGRTDVYAARVASDGSVLDPGGFALATSALPETWPAAAGLGGGAALLSWSAFQDEPPYTAYRIARTVMNGPVPISADVTQLSLAAGGVQTCSLDAGATNGLGLFFLLTTTAGTTPGQPLPPTGLVLPLNSSSLFLFTALNPGLLIPGSLGFLDPSGQATRALTLPPGLDPSLAGTTLHHAFLLLDPVQLTATFASNAVALSLTP